MQPSSAGRLKSNNYAEILQFLSIKDLRNARLVSKTFRELVPYVKYQYKVEIYDTDRKNKWRANVTYKDIAAELFILATPHFKPIIQITKITLLNIPLPQQDGAKILFFSAPFIKSFHFLCRTLTNASHKRVCIH